MQDFTIRQLTRPINTLAIPTCQSLEKTINVVAVKNYLKAGNERTELLNFKVTHWGRDRYSISAYNATSNSSYVITRCDASKSILDYISSFNYVIS